MDDTLTSVEVLVSDPGELRSLREHLQRAPAVEVRQIPGVPGPGEQGVWDVLQVLAASGGALAVAVGTIPVFVWSRRSNVSVAVKTGGKTITITANNVEDVMPVVERALDA